MCTFGLSGCRVKPRRLRGRRGFTGQPENSKRAHLSAPTLQTPPKFHERTPKERKKKENCGGRREKKARNFGPPTLRGSTLRGSTLRGPTLRGPHPSGPPPFGAPLFLGFGPPPFGPTVSRFGASTIRGPTLRGPHTLSSQNSTFKNWPKSKLAEVEIGRSRNWPKSNWPNSKKKLAEVEIGRSRSRSPSQPVHTSKPCDQPRHVRAQRA